MASSLLSAAIEDSISWCSRICASHGSHELVSPTSWANLGPSPPYYPNIITRKPHAQGEIVRLSEIVRQQNPNRCWGIKDSFADLDLISSGFHVAIKGQWFAGEPAAAGQKSPHEWEIVRGAEELSRWERAWSETSDHRIFQMDLLDDSRIRFWMLRQAGDIIAGCISFASGPVIGLSNWFSKGAGTAFDLGIMNVVRRPVVLWAADDHAAASPSGLKTLGKLRVWMTEALP